MATTAKPRPTRPLKRRRIIERPRLLALLDESNARVRTLVAPAGYGKTTLAEQWVARSGRRSAWYTARSASTDVAALALGVARAAAELVPGCEERLREHLRAVPNPGEHVDVLAEILGEELVGWASDDWLVLDDYHELAAASDAERFVGELVRQFPLQLLIGSRVRPAWASGRSILYGEVLELNQTALAMDSHEAAELLSDRSPESATGLVALANGWPAVIGLASVSSAEIDEDLEVPESLYRFFAEEVFGALGPDVQAYLATLATLPLLDRELVGKLLADRAEHVLSATLDVGVLVERGTMLEIHPLARSFLEERNEQLGVAPDPAASARALAHYRSHRDWDAAFELVARRHLAHELEPLLSDALDELLAAARLQTIDSWCKLALEASLDSPLFSVARAELSLRQGRHAEAETFAESAAVTGSPHAFRALCVAGRAAHLASREEKALELYERGELAAASDSERRDARWGQLMCLIDLERDDAGAALEDLLRGVRPSDPRDYVRAAMCKLQYQIRLSAFDLDDVEVAWRMRAACSDALIRASFENAYAHSLALAARYDEALDAVRGFFDTAQRYRLEFARPYGLLTLAIASAGKRRWSAAHKSLAEAQLLARSSRDLYAEQCVYAQQIRTLAQEGRSLLALALPVPTLTGSLKSIQAEIITSRAFVSASAGRLDEAVAALGKAEGLSRDVEQAILSQATRAIVALRRHDPSAIELAIELEDTSFSLGALDLLIAAYRSLPELLAVLLRASRDPGRTSALVRQVADEDLAEALGYSVAMAGDPVARLTKRELEIYGLMSRGLANREIAELLVISESTVKLHVHHIYDKLGVRSRAAVVVQAALRRSDQATSATPSSDASDTS